MKKFIIGIVISFFGIVAEPVIKYENFESILLSRNPTGCKSIDNYLAYVASLKNPPASDEEEARKNEYSCYTIPARRYFVIQIDSQKIPKFERYFAWLFVTSGKFISKSEEAQKKNGITLVVMISGEEAKGIK